MPKQHQYGRRSSPSDVVDGRADSGGGWQRVAEAAAAVASAQEVSDTSRRTRPVRLDPERKECPKETKQDMVSNGKTSKAAAKLEVASLGPRARGTCVAD